MDHTDIANYSRRLAAMRNRALADAGRYVHTADEHHGMAEAYTHALDALFVYSDGAHGEEHPIMTKAVSA